MTPLQELISQHKAGRPVGICSVCSAHPQVIEAALRRAHDDGTLALIEATSNQVNQDGGYTGQRPAGFRDRVRDLATSVGLPWERVVLGGDHLGPNCWQALPAEEAMRKSEVLIDEYVAAGFRKIHLDCSMSCADDPEPLGDSTVAERAARLCAIAERRWEAAGGDAPVYIVGTEVPVPGGATEALETLEVTGAVEVAATIAAHREAFARRGQAAAWDRVIGLVVQPGVEFDHDKVVDYDPPKARVLSKRIEREPNMVFEAHSTDYQTTENLEALVRDHFAILKVGPALTYALREALWALDDIDRDCANGGHRNGLRKTVLAVMRQRPAHWQRHYLSRGARLTLDMQYSLSDRIRYYWPDAEVTAAVQALLARLEASPPPLTVVRQYLPEQYQAIRNGELANEPRDLVLHKIDAVLRQYADACRQGERCR
jgi:D-tagatose-1,6-bisphosphate aldolase subunit GatZ/KbaZ